MPTGRKPPVRLKSCRVKHPFHGEVLVQLENPNKPDEDVLAIKKAAEIWRVEWTRIAATSIVTPAADQCLRCTCSRCGREFLSTTDADRCDACKLSVRDAQRRFDKAHKVDRRTNASPRK